MRLALFLLLAPLLCAQPAPVAKRVPHSEVRHGETTNDPYFWLREKQNPEVSAYLESENAYTAQLTKHLEPLSETLYKEMLGRIKQTDLSVPLRRGSYLYYARTEAGKQYPIQCRRKGSMEAPEEVMLDLNELAKGLKFFSLGMLKVSPNENLVAYATDTTGFRQYKLAIRDLTTGKNLPTTAERLTSLEWAADNQTLLYSTEDAVTKRSNQLWRLPLTAAAPTLLLEEKDELYNIQVGKTRDAQFLMLAIGATDSTEFHYVAANRAATDPFQLFLARQKQHKYFVDHRAGLFYIRSNREKAKNFQVYTTPVGKPAPANWKLFIPHQPTVLLQNLDLFANHAVAVEKSAAVNTLRVYNFKTATWKPLQFPEPIFTALPSGNAVFEATTYRYTYQSMVTPSSVFEYDLLNGSTKLLKQQEVLGGYNPKDYVSERVWATARDGVKVPLSVVYKKGLVRDGKAPLFLYAYGSYGIGMPANFQSNRLSLLDRGMTYVIAHIRGGDEMGEAWHDDGMLMKKKNTFNDFVDSAEYLIKNKWTSADRLVIEGGSAGGLLMGAVVNQRPDLFRAVHAAVPFVDVMNTMMDATLPLTVGEYLEWGNPNEKAAYDYMKSYSPYDNLEKRAYPAMLVTTSFNDSQVMYWEPAKYVARLRTLKTDQNPLLLKTNMGAGHGGASGRYDRLRDTAFQYAWFLDQVGLSR